MLKQLRNRIKGQSTAEYAILIALVVAAVIAMQTYAKRALQGRIRDASLYMQNQIRSADTTTNRFNTIQYEPYYLSSEFETTRNSTSNMFSIGSANQSVRTSGQLSNINVSRAENGEQKFDFNRAVMNDQGL